LRLEAFQAAELDKARLEERLNQAPQATEAAKPVPPSREQLQAWVDGGQITQSDMDREIARQDREAIKAELRTELTQEFSTREQLKTIKSQFDAYVKSRPDVKAEGTEDRRRFQEEFQALIDLGQPADMRTEVVAMRAAFGSLDRVQETTRQRRETHAETGGAGSGPAGGSTKEPWHKDLTPGQIALYQKQLDEGKLFPGGTDDPMFKGTLTRARTKNIEKRKAS
jgi:hypothetical protein